MRDGTIGSEFAVPAGASFHRVTATDRDEAEEMLGRFHGPLHVATAADEPIRMTTSALRLGPLTVAHLVVGPTTQFASDVVSGYHVAYPLTGELRSRHLGRCVIARPSAVAAVFRDGAPCETRHLAGTDVLGVTIERAALEDELESMIGRRVPAIDLAPAMDVSAGPGRTWAELVRLLRDESGDGTGLIYQPLIASRLWHSVLTGLLLAVPHRYADELTRPVRPGPPRAIRSVVDAIQAEPHRPFTARQLAELGGMSVRSLQEGFRRHLGSTPMGYLRHVRLAQAHEALRGADPQSTTVAAVAHRWGFTHLGRFAQAYRLRYGVHPSATLRATG